MEVVTILITGASGNIGKEVLKQIAQTGAQVRAAFQSVNKATAAPSGVETVTVDYNQRETLLAALKGVDRVFLVGPPTSQLPVLERKAMDVITVGCSTRSEAFGNWRARSNISAAACRIRGLHPVLRCALYVSATERIHAKHG